MTHLCLGISACDLQIPGRHEEAFLLLCGGLVKQGGQEHAQVKIQRLRSPSVYRASKKYQGQAIEGSIIRCARINNVSRQSRGRKNNSECESVTCTSSWPGGSSALFCVTSDSAMPVFLKWQCVAGTAMETQHRQCARAGLQPLGW